MLQCQQNKNLRDTNFYEIESTKLSHYNLIVKTFICRQENNGKIFLGRYISFNLKMET
jgi:cytidylate kinase